MTKVAPLKYLFVTAFLAFMLHGRNMTNSQQQHSKYILYVGSYGKGIQAYRYDSSNQQLTPLPMTGEVINPSWIIASADYKHLYAVSELEGDTKGEVAAFAINRKSGALTSLNQRSSEGVAPCHLAIDHAGKVLVVANYTSGNVASFPLLNDGRIGEIAALMGATGSGPNKQRQEGPHAHETVFASNHLLYVPDLGLDQIRVFKVDSASAQLTTGQPTHSSEEPGMGPRHIVFSKDESFAYVINELTPAVDVFTHNLQTGELTSIQTISTVPEHQTGEVGPAEILLSASGKYLYASNRGPGTIAVFSVDAQSGKLSKIDVVETGLSQVRGVDFDPTGEYLFIGDQKANKFKTFQIDSSTGKLKPTGKTYETPSPVAFLFVPEGE